MSQLCFEYDNREVCGKIEIGNKMSWEKGKEPSYVFIVFDDDYPFIMYLGDTAQVNTNIAKKYCRVIDKYGHENFRQYQEDHNRLLKMEEHQQRETEEYKHLKTKIEEIDITL